MSHTLVLHLPHEVYEHLLKSAERVEQTPEEFVVHCLENAVLPPEEDPLEKFIGAWRSNIPNWADQHDKYLGEAHLSSHR